MLDPEEIAKWEKEAAGLPDPEYLCATAFHCASSRLHDLVQRAAAIIKQLGDALDAEHASSIRDEEEMARLHRMLQEAQEPRCRNCGRAGHDECGTA